MAGNPKVESLITSGTEIEKEVLPRENVTYINMRTIFKKSEVKRRRSTNPAFSLSWQEK
jgi:hypothetical protein